MTQVNIYQSKAEWCFAAFVEGEFDSSDTLSAQNQAQAEIEALALYPEAKITKVEDIA